MKSKNSAGPFHCRPRAWAPCGRGQRQFRRVDFLGGFVQLIALEEGIKTLDGTDAYLAVFATNEDLSRCTLYSSVNLRLSSMRHIRHHLLLRLFAEVSGIHQNRMRSPCGAEQAVDGRDGREVLPAPVPSGSGRGTAGLERRFQIGDAVSGNCAGAVPSGEMDGIEWRDMLQAFPQAGALSQPSLERFGPVKTEYLARTRSGVARRGEEGNNAGAFVETGQRLFVVDPLQHGRRIAFCWSSWAVSRCPSLAPCPDHAHRFLSTNRT